MSAPIYITAALAFDIDPSGPAVDRAGGLILKSSLPAPERHLHRIIEKGARADLYLATRFARPIIWDVEIAEEAAPIRVRPMAHLIVLSLIALCAEAYWVGFLSGPYGVRGLVLFTSILVAGWTCGALTGFFGALAARGT